MLNIISRSAKAKTVGGQIKVFQNLVKGLERIGYPYVVNRRLDACEKLWIHDDTRALPLLNNLPPQIKVVIGPNLYVMPRDIPKGLALQRAIYLHPCAWAVDIWKTHGFDLCPLRAWPVGIDTELFNPERGGERGKVLIYHKYRPPSELEHITRVVTKLGLEYKVIICGKYKQEEYIAQLLQSKYVIWHGRSESQGIALQEAMACDVPVLLWDVTHLGQYWAEDGNCYPFDDMERGSRVTAAPYFNDTCGIRIESGAELEAAVRQMEDLWEKFVPRDFVVRNLSLEKQARELLDFYGDWEHDTLPHDPDRVISHGKWRPPISWLLEAVARRLMRYLTPRQ